MIKLFLINIIFILWFLDPVFARSSYSVKVYSSVNNQNFSSRSKTVEFNDSVELFAVIKYQGKRYGTHRPSIKNGSIQDISRLKAKVSFKWQKIEANETFYDLTYKSHIPKESDPLSVKLRFKAMSILRNYIPIEYGENSFGVNSPSIYLSQNSTKVNIYTSDSQPTLESATMKWRGEFVGTMRYAVVALIDGIKVKSPGVVEMNQGVGELSTRRFSKMDLVHRISKKADTGNEILDQAFSLGNLPYIYGSSSYRFSYYGSDCAKLVSVAYQKSVYPKMKYQSTHALIKKKASVMVSGVDANGFFFTRINGFERRIVYGEDIHIGDIWVSRDSKTKTFFGGAIHHAGLVGEDSNQNGFLDKDDFIFHTYWASPRYEKIGNTELALPSRNSRILKRFY